MIKRFLCALPLALTLLNCAAQERVQPTPTAVPPTPASAKPSALEELKARARKRNGGKEPNKIEVFNEFLHDARLAAGTVMDTGQPRIVPRGARPEIIIKDSKVTYNDRELVLGAALKEWVRILGAPSRFGKSIPTVLYIWDDLGLDILTDQTAKGENIVIQITIHLNKVPINPYLIEYGPDGKPLPPNVAPPPKNSFPGYLELDGFGIDAKTEFREVRAAAKPSRNLHCGILDCSTPSGGLGENSGKLTLDLNRSNDHGNINEFTISR